MIALASGVVSGVRNPLRAELVIRTGAEDALTGSGALTTGAAGRTQAAARHRPVTTMTGKRIMTHLVS
jgi:hypothetical protein